VLPDRCKETVKGFLASIPERLKATLTRACTDMYDGFINAVRCKSACKTDQVGGVIGVQN
jgi:hypothetical protein